MNNNAAEREKTDRTLEAFLDETMSHNDLPGLVIGVSCGSDRNCYEFTGARGYRNYITKEPLLKDDIFHCASVSKLFTSTAVMRLVEEGVLNIYDRLSRLLPDLVFDDGRYEEIRLWNMLTHSSGLGDCDNYHWEAALTDENSLRNYLLSDEVLKQPMLWDPQTSPDFYGVPEYDCEGREVNLFRYSNVAYEILGHIVSEYSGADRLSYEDFVQEKLIKAAGMTDSTMKTFERPGWKSDTTSWSGGNMALPHEKLADKSIGVVKYYPYTRSHGPSSTLTSTAADLLKWGRSHLAASSGKGRGVLKQDSYDTVWRNYATVPNNGEKMGLGWFCRQEKGYTLWGHEGTDDGFRASFWLCPELNIVTVVLSNLSNAKVKKINRKLFASLVEEI